MNDSRVDDSHIILATKGCPGSGCDDARNEGRIIYWSHSCNSTSYLDKNANVICYNCDTKYSILNAKFKCKYDNQYRDINYLKLGRVLSGLSAIEDARVKISKFNKKQLEDFLDNISDQLFKLK